MDTKELASKLFLQAVKECLPGSNGVYNALPNHMGKAMERFGELCKQNNICVHCWQPINENHNCLCE